MTVRNSIAWIKFDRENIERVHSDEPFEFFCHHCNKTIENSIPQFYENDTIKTEKYHICPFCHYLVKERKSNDF